VVVVPLWLALMIIAGVYSFRLKARRRKISGNFDGRLKRSLNQYIFSPILDQGKRHMDDKPKQYSTWISHPSSSSTRHIQQIGPSCGLAALLMTKNSSSTHTIATLLALAKSLLISKQGELFHTSYILQLAHKIDLPAKIITFPSPSSLKEIIDGGGLLLFAYDRDRDNTPTKNGGKSAHWALVISYLTCPEGKDGIDEIVLVCRHGKSRLLGYWTYDEIMESNDQLREAGVQGNEWVVPGNLDGLRGLAVVM
jgi:hypothetical protein